jgi:hypothetical protein
MKTRGRLAGMVESASARAAPSWGCPPAILGLPPQSWACQVQPQCVLLSVDRQRSRKSLTKSAKSKSQFKPVGHPVDCGLSCGQSCGQTGTSDLGGANPYHHDSDKILLAAQVSRVLPSSLFSFEITAEQIRHIDSPAVTVIIFVECTLSSHVSVFPQEGIEISRQRSWRRRIRGGQEERR